MPAFPALRTIRSHSTLLHTARSITARAHITSQTNARPTPPYSVRLHTALNAPGRFFRTSLNCRGGVQAKTVQCRVSTPFQVLPGGSTGSTWIPTQFWWSASSKYSREQVVTTLRSASAECSRFCVRALTSGQFLADTPISVSVMFH